MMWSSGSSNMAGHLPSQQPAWPCERLQASGFRTRPAFEYVVRQMVSRASPAAPPPSPASRSRTVHELVERVWAAPVDVPYRARMGQELEELRVGSAVLAHH